MTPEHYEVLGAVISITADAESTDGDYTVLDILAPAGFENGFHTHEPAEVFHVVDGEIDLFQDGDSERLGAGESAHVPAGAEHGFRAGEDGCRVIAVMSPGGAEAFFRAVGRPIDERTIPEPHPVSEADLGAVFATGAEHGFEFLGPLPAN